VLDFLGQRALPGVESLEGSAYTRSLRLPHGHGIVTLRAPAVDAASDGDRDGYGGPGYVEGELRLSDLRDLTTAVARCRQLLDLDADPVAVWEALRAVPGLGPVVERDPGRRVAGAADGFELAVRAVIGQQVSVSGARTVAGRLVQAAGDTLPAPDGTVTSLFPTPAALADLAERDPGAFAMPAGRRRALVALSRAVDAGDVVIDPGADPLELRRSLVALPGIGPWTAEYVAMRALRDPDAFMPTDLGIRRGAAALGLPDQPGPLTELSRAWRPWRSYAMAHLWSLPAASTPQLPARPVKGRAA
jgi:AraC family transcriptional regulator of adaptative response / DNA-3-methyladenine glycosylase II